MTSNVSIFDLDGIKIADLTANVRRTWKLNDYGQAFFTLSENDAISNLRYVQFGRYMTVEHDKLGMWGGMIDPPRNWGYHQFEVVSYSAEYVLKQMRTPMNWTMGSGDPGKIIQKLISDSDGFKESLLQFGEINHDGHKGSHDSHLANLLDDVKTIIKNHGGDLGIEPTINSSGRLSFILSYYSKRGQTRLSGLDENSNCKLMQRPMIEQGTIINDMIGYDSTEGTWDNRMRSRKIDETSQNEYGRRYSAFSHTVGHQQNASDNLTQKHLDANKQPRKTFDLAALDVNNTFYNLRIGDVIPIHLSTIGFTDAGFGLDTTGRIIGMTYDDLSGELALVFDEDTTYDA